MKRKDPHIDLTHHLKIWFGQELKEEHIQRLINQKKLNPKHDILLVVNAEILSNPENTTMLDNLKNAGIKVADINKIVPKDNLEEMRLLYIVQALIKKAAPHKKYFTPYAAASDIARWIPSLIKYECDEGYYRIYSDTDYYFYKIPSRINGEYLFGDYNMQKRIIFKDAKAMDGNLIALNPDHELAKIIRNAWTFYFKINHFLPKGYEKLDKVESKDEIQGLDIDDEQPTSEDKESEEIENKIQEFSENPGISNLQSIDKDKFLSNPAVLVCQRLDEAIILNLSERSHKNIKSEIFSIGNLTIDFHEDEKKLDIHIESIARFKDELICFLGRGKVFEMDSLKFNPKEGDPIEFKQSITDPKKMDHALNMIAAFVDARNLSTLLKGNMQKNILERLTTPSLVSQSGQSMFSLVQTEKEEEDVKQQSKTKKRS